MIIPKSVHIGPFRVPVKRSSDALVGIAEDGTTIYFGISEQSLNGGQIILREDMGVDREGETFMHELLEQIVANYGLELNHIQISVISMALYHALKDGGCLAIQS